MENLEEHLRIQLSDGHAFHLKGSVGPRCTGSLLNMDEMHLEGSWWGLLGRGSLGECKEPYQRGDWAFLRKGSLREQKELPNRKNGRSPRRRRNFLAGRRGTPREGKSPPGRYVPEGGVKLQLGMCCVLEDEVHGGLAAAL